MEHPSPRSLDCMVSETAGFRYVARIAPVARPNHTVSFSLHSTWSGAWNPDAAQRVVTLTLDAAALARLCALLEAGRRIAQAEPASYDDAGS